MKRIEGEGGMQMKEKSYECEMDRCPCKNKACRCSCHNPEPKVGESGLEDELSVECTFCKQPVGKPCRHLGNYKVKEGFHFTRSAALQKSRLAASPVEKVAPQGGEEETEELLKDVEDFVDRHSESWYGSGQELLARIRAYRKSESVAPPSLPEQEVLGKYRDQRTYSQALSEVDRYAAELGLQVPSPGDDSVTYRVKVLVDALNASRAAVPVEPLTETMYCGCRSMCSCKASDQPHCHYCKAGM